jgi:hypothetical protein
MRKSYSFFLAVGLAAISAQGCGLLLGTNSFQNCCEGWGAAPPDGCVVCGRPGAGGGATGGGNGTFCSPGAKRGCYSAKDQSTQNQAPCHAGIQYCNADGSAWGVCSGETVPKDQDDCSVPGDDSNCNGKHDCLCEPGGKPEVCYDGPPGTEGKGTCKAGTKQCLPTGTAYGPCENQVVPDPNGKDDCVNNQDTNCDNMLMCSCTPGAVQPCYNADPSTLGHPNAPCKAGTQTCNMQGSGFDMCMNEVKPAALDDCGGGMGNGIDENCDGVIDDLCVCTPGGPAVACYSGPPGTSGKGICHDGTKACNATGTGYLACTGEQDPLTEDCSKKGDENCDGVGCSDAIWANVYTCTDANTRLKGLAVDPQGGAAIVGYFSGTLSQSNGQVTSHGLKDYFLIKVDAAGQIPWSWHFGDLSDNGTIVGVATDKNGNVAIGGSLNATANFGGAALMSAGSSDIFVAEYDSVGTHKWSTRFGGAGFEEATAVGMTTQGDVIVAGAFSGAFSICGKTLTPVAGVDVFVARLSGADGSCLWAKGFGDVGGQPAGDQIPLGVWLDTGNNIFVTGQFTKSITFGTSLLSAGANDIFLAKLDVFGTHLWSARYGGPNDDVATAVAVDSAGGPVITGQISSTVNFGGANLPGALPGDLFVAKFDTLGAHEWSASYASAKIDLGRGVAVDAQDNVIVTGETTGTSIDLGGGALVDAANNGVNDVFLAKYSPGGSYLWSKLFGDAGNQYSSAVGVDRTTNQVMLAFFNGGLVDLGTGPLAAGGASSSIVVGRFNP